MKRFCLFLSTLVLLVITAGCDLGTPRTTGTPEGESMARYRELYKKSGGFDPVAKSLGQKMK